MNMFIGNKQLKKYISTGICTFYYSDIFYKTNTHFFVFETVSNTNHNFYTTLVIKWNTNQGMVSYIVGHN